MPVSSFARIHRKMTYVQPLRPALLAMLLTLAVPGFAAADPPKSPGLQAFDRLLGKCLVGSVGPGATDTHCFEPVFGGKHVRDRHVVTVDGKAVYRGETIYSRADDEIAFTYVNSLGGNGQGKARDMAGGIAFTGSMRAAPDSAMQPMDSTWRWQAGGSYDAGDGSGKPVTFRPFTSRSRKR